MNTYERINREVERDRPAQRAAAKEWASKWLDPFTYLDEDETPYTELGGIDIEKAHRRALSAFATRANRHTELTAILSMYNRALIQNEKIIYLEQDEVQQAKNIIQLPRLDIAQHPRNCAVCATRTSSGIRALCDSCHQRFIIDKNWKNTPLTFDEVASAILRSDNRHRIDVETARKQAAA